MIEIVKSKHNLIAVIIVIFILILIYQIYRIYFNSYYDKFQISEYFEKYQLNIYEQVREKLINFNCSLMSEKDRKFLNGIIREKRPKKILELGVFLGGSSVIILNAIKDIKDAHLYSIDISSNKRIGSCVENFFPFLAKKWTLYKGDIESKFLEKIGRNIDIAIIDTSHFEPGEILDFLIVLPFLKDEAIVIFHDIAHQILDSQGENMRNEWAPYIIFNLIRGIKFFPSGEGILTKNIGGILLEKNQKVFIHDYCRALGGQWQYFPLEKQIESIRKFFNKYHDDYCRTTLEESIKFNKQFVKDNPKGNYYLIRDENRKNQNRSKIKDYSKI